MEENIFIHKIYYLTEGHARWPEHLDNRTLMSEEDHPQKRVSLKP